MRSITISTACAALLLVASCSPPGERCEASISVERKNVTRLLQEVDGNLKRGYAFEDSVARSSGLRFCAGSIHRSSSRVGVGYSGCYGGSQTTRQRVPIDPVAEMRKRDALEARLAALSSNGGARCVTRVDPDRAF